MPEAMTDLVASPDDLAEAVGRGRAVTPDGVPEALVAAALEALENTGQCTCCELTREDIVRIVLASALPG